MKNKPLVYGMLSALALAFLVPTIIKIMQQDRAKLVLAIIDDDTMSDKEKLERIKTIRR